MSLPEPDFDAIKRRDDAWEDNGRETPINLACRDRHVLLLYVSELLELCEEIEVDVRRIKQVHRQGYLPKPPPEPVPTDEQGQAGKGFREFHEQKASGKLPP